MKKDYSELIISKLQEYAKNIETFYTTFLDTQDDEVLHQLRVNIRKSRVILKAFHEGFDAHALQKIDKKLSKIAKSSNKTRDLDVFLDACYHHFALHINNLPITFYEKLLHTRRDERATLEIFLKSKFIEDTMSEYKNFLKESKPFKLKKEKSFKKILAKHFNRIDILYKVYLQNAEEENLHKIRINLKKIRYLLEAFEEKLRSSKQQNILLRSKNLQKSLGLFNDLSIQKLFIENYIRKENEENNQVFIAFVQEIQKQKEVLKEQIEPLLLAFIEGSNGK
ncbi:CHAD domain-containing protein [bacterium]|nr:CHAD domain-containing protein [bacterium]MBU1959496.1 CHAD domain-containing protein [bacterium]